MTRHTAASPNAAARCHPEELERHPRQRLLWRDLSAGSIQSDKPVRTVGADANFVCMACQLPGRFPLLRNLIMNMHKQIVISSDYAARAHMA